MAQVGIDLMRLKPSKGYNYVIMAIDYFTKYVEMGVLKDKSAESIAIWIYKNIFCCYGITDIHITDNGTEFVNKISKELYARHNVAHRITCPYQPTASFIGVAFLISFFFSVWQNSSLYLNGHYDEGYLFLFLLNI